MARPIPAVPAAPTEPAIIVVVKVPVADKVTAPPASTAVGSEMYASVSVWISAIAIDAATPTSSATPKVAAIDSMFSEDSAVTLIAPPALTVASWPM